jgi:hypothetical protein
MCSEIQLHQHTATAKKAVRDWTNRDHKKYLTGPNAKGFLQGPSARRNEEQLKLNTNHL